MSEANDDLSAVAWVLEELRRSLDAAHKGLRRFLKELEAVEGSDTDAVDPQACIGNAARFDSSVFRRRMLAEVETAAAEPPAPPGGRRVFGTTRPARRAARDLHH